MNIGWIGNFIKFIDSFPLSTTLGLGLGQQTSKEKAHPARVAVVGQENIETVHEPKLTQTEGTL